MTDRMESNKPAVLPLFPDDIATPASPPRFPSTRYQGSKRKLLPWIWEQVGELPFETALDVFGGTGSVSFLFKQHGKQVTYNDLLASNHQVGTALVANSRHRLSEADIEHLFTRHPAVEYDDLIERTFEDIYFTTEENRWLDLIAQNIRRLSGRYRRAVAYYALFQSCLAKRPYNLFHRKNLYMRTATVSRGFGNKATWDRSFEDHFHKHLGEVHRAIFDNGRRCSASRHDVLDVPGRFDLVYIDPPYVSARNVGVDYLAFYHFLEGLTDYPNWPQRIDYTSKHRRIKPVANRWLSAETNVAAFRDLFQRYADSILVVSYRSDGCPTPQQLMELLGEVKDRVRLVSLERYRYVLSTNRSSSEVLLIGQ